MQESWADVEASGRWLLHLAQNYKPNLIHLNSFGHGALPWQAPVVVTAHSCVLSWWQAVKHEPAPDAWNRYRDLVKASLSAADIVTTPTLAMASALSAHYELPLQACAVVPNGRNASRFHRGEKEPFVLTAGRLWDEAKNIRAVAEIAPKLSWPVYCAGDTAGTLDRCTGGCTMLGRLSTSDLAQWYSRASIYAMPAHYEPFGLSILEAALSGCALVLGDIPSLREIWKDAAVFVSPENPQALETALRNLIADTHLREYLSRRACTRALAFDSGRAARGWMDAYQAAIDFHRTKTPTTFAFESAKARSCAS
jgi:glycosyltransferase involved in cell wall biosynthesis